MFGKDITERNEGRKEKERKREMRAVLRRAVLKPKPYLDLPHF